MFDLIMNLSSRLKRVRPIERSTVADRDLVALVNEAHSDEDIRRATTMARLRGAR
jgi:hypothetical protein